MKTILKVLMIIFFFALTNCKDDDDADPRDAYIGTWEVVIEIDCDGDLDEYEDTIVISKGSSGKLIINIEASALEANLSGSNFTIPAQEVEDDVEVSGSGSFSGDTIHAILESEDGTGEECDYVLDGHKL